MTVENDASTFFGVSGAGSIVVLDVLVEAEDVELIAKGLGKTPETATGVDIDSSFSGAGFSGPGSSLSTRPSRFSSSSLSRPGS